MSTDGLAQVDILGCPVDFHLVEDNFPIPQDGILGSDFFKQFKIKLNYELNQLEWGNISIPFEAKEILTIPARANSQIYIQVVNPEIKEGYVPRLKLAEGVYLEDDNARARQANPQPLKSSPRRGSMWEEPEPICRGVRTRQAAASDGDSIPFTRKELQELLFTEHTFQAQIHPEPQSNNPVEHLEQLLPEGNNADFSPTLSADVDTQDDNLPLTTDNTINSQLALPPNLLQILNELSEKLSNDKTNSNQRNPLINTSDDGEDNINENILDDDISDIYDTDNTNNQPHELHDNYDSDNENDNESNIDNTFNEFNPYEPDNSDQSQMNYINNCLQCQLKKVVRTKTKQPMLITDTSYTAFEKISLNIVGPLPVTSQNNSYILTIQDHLTKFSLAIPLQSATAVSVANAFLESFICTFGAPKAILTDQGTNFTSKLLKRFAKQFRIKQFQTTTFYPQANGALERSHFILVEFLKQFVNRFTEWDKLVRYAAFSYNTSTHEATGYTPYKLVFGKLARLPSNEINDAEEPRAYDDYLTQLMTDIHNLQELAREHIIASKNQKRANLVINILTLIPY
ncbi:hypothetical protein DMN91_007390 [Ooceraea biroi]|uniref:Integrase catalytic domain-containing protein n=1 Tax=Ooceraea biroi TaxID=2015173 RepID=A0A3L8DKA9_OOCBI|nr:hypothetical protein DMN91_007390 [Ooceraea biroi]